jgi:ATP-dependent helicase/nuclease subunit B
MARASAILLHSLHATQVRPLRLEEPRISILGLLEARLMRPDMVILGGLNEGIWPGQPDPGPWLNRPMRETLSMPQPERQIGQTAHDFVQALAVKEVKLVWARRLGNDPAIPSRFVLRLKMLLAGAKHSEPSGENWVGLAMAMRTARNLKPHARPRPLPPLEARPRRLSVSRIEQLLRDPYAIYARHVLELEPLHEVGAVPDHALKGIIFHDIIGTFLKTHGETLPADIGGEIMALASRCFGRVRDAPGALAFWWPRFRRIAGWFAEQERAERLSVQRVLAEISGALDLEVAPGFSFRLTCRADRIDVLKDGSARIADYKTGHVPSQSQVEQGLAPQLGLEAAILQGGGFGDVGTLTVSDLSYIKLSGGEPPAKVKSITTDISASALAEMYLARLTGLIAAYRSETRPFLPRTFAEKDEEELDYDHLSRFREWSPAGGAP